MAPKVYRKPASAVAKKPAIAGSDDESAEKGPKNDVEDAPSADGMNMEMFNKLDYQAQDCLRLKWGDTHNGPLKKMRPKALKGTSGR